MTKKRRIILLLGFHVDSIYDCIISNKMSRFAWFKCKLHVISRTGAKIIKLCQWWDNIFVSKFFNSVVKTPLCHKGSLPLQLMVHKFQKDKQQQFSRRIRAVFIYEHIVCFRTRRTEIKAFFVLFMRLKWHRIILRYIFIKNNRF